MQTRAHFENDNQDNFAFLKDGLGELYKQAVLAERYYFTDPQSSMAKIRLFVELACHELGMHFKLRPPVHGDLSNKIKMLQASHCIEEWVIGEMNILRHDGNRSVHMTEVNGAYIAEMKVSRTRMKKHMSSLFEIANYVGKTILGTQPKSYDTWQEPKPCELSSLVTDALKGSKEASYYLANRIYTELLEMSEQTGKSRWWQKEQYLDKQADLRYWLEKSHRQGHPQSWLLFAKCQSNKLLPVAAKRNVKECFKQALKFDEDGEVAFEFGSYLLKHEETKLGADYIRQSAERGYHQALSFQLDVTFRSGGNKENWVERAIEYRLPEAFTAEVFLKLETYEAEPTEDTLKALRSALVVAQSRRSPGIALLKSYVDLTVYAVQQRDKSAQNQAIQAMVDSYESVPAYLDVELRLFNQISQDDKHYDLMIKIYHQSIQQVRSEIEAAGIKYTVVKHALSKAGEKFKMRDGVKTPKPIPTLLQEAADAGHSEARAYVNSAEGKALLKRIGFTCQGKMHKNAAEKQKNKRKRKRKLVKQAKRNS
ncbi:hypothetical protein VII00023_15518 [Vibrio ichthyoenteri ATCC 700023]|uniref:DUF4145 domain-containing protein n=1 Tax=Vibrio ichthyoenteri ATCC 700023 TaxID=870968 RepID=F9S629_9VIBR|nr:DUF4145 domain-containing protein [Vibrio ichthyoenteri]EGU34050.1 hypothetical protein VII00023_15518 [Vibrio ichthyoenteri ATCC 700023]